MTTVQIGNKTFVKGAPTVVEKEKPKVIFVKYADLKPGDTVVVGEYVKVEFVPSLDPKKPQVPKHYFKVDGDCTVVLNSSVDLDRKLAKEGIGAILDIVFTGKTKVKLSNGITIFPFEFEVSPLTEQKS